jgi:hypothetical protein
MKRRRTAILGTILVTVLAAVTAGLLPCERHVDGLERYSGKGRTVRYAGMRERDGGGSSVLFRYFNGSSQKIQFIPIAVVQQAGPRGEWILKDVAEKVGLTVPAQHALTFELRPPEGEGPWRVTFEEEPLPDAVQSMVHRLERLVPWKRSAPKDGWANATPLMQGLRPRVESPDTVDASPATETRLSNGDDGGGHRR